MKEHDIRPKAIFDEYLRLAALDVQLLFADAPCVCIACPACLAEGSPAFKKNGFQYALCDACQTLYVSPRPVAESFRAYYTDSASTRYWATTFYRETEAARREKIWKPKAALVAQKVRRFGGAAHVVDIGGGYGTFAEEVRALGGFELTVIEPSVHLARVCRDKKLRVVERFLEDIGAGDLGAGPKSFVSFEIFEHLTDPAAFLQSLYRLMQPGDLFIFTTLSGTGLDIQVLWEKSKSVSPPHHLNFFNPWSVRSLLRRVGFETVEVTTPGHLDVDILGNNAGDIPERFWKTFLQFADEQQKSAAQAFMTASGFSSHMMVVCRRPLA